VGHRAPSSTYVSTTCAHRSSSCAPMACRSPTNPT
jgi:hypothetical protein